MDRLVQLAEDLLVAGRPGIATGAARACAGSRGTRAPGVINDSDELPLRRLPLVLLRPAETTPGLHVKPRLRGLSHEIAFFLVLPLGAALNFEVYTPRARVSAIVVAASVAAMFGASGLYHRVSWSPRRRRWMAASTTQASTPSFAGTYTPLGLLVLHGAWSVVVLAIVWSGGAAPLAALMAGSVRADAAGVG